MGRPWRRWEDNIRMELQEIGINAGNWVDSAQERNYWRALVNPALNLRIRLAMELVSVAYAYFGPGKPTEFITVLSPSISVLL